MLIRKSDYYLNKNNKEAIVCRNAAGKCIELKREDFINAAEFERWKKWSDEEYHQEENATRRTTRKNWALNEYIDMYVFCNSAEELVLEKQDKREKIDKVLKIRNCLTETQYRRLWLYYVEGMNMRQIGEKEGVSTSCVSSSIYGAKKKILKKLGNLAK